MIRENLRVTQSRQKSFVDKRRDLSFEVGDFVYLKVSPMRGTHSERPVKILDIAERGTRNKVIKMCKVQWSHHTEDEATWEHEEELREDYPEFFLSTS
jgi:hypothetical protein